MTKRNQAKRRKQREKRWAMKNDRDRYNEERWFYDSLFKTYEHYAATYRDRRQILERITQRYSDTKTREWARGLLEMIESGLKIQELNCDILRNAKPFLIGPATAESLITVEPRSYNDIMAGRLPFAHMFFEFYRPQTMIFPLSGKERSVRGIKLRSLEDIVTKNYYYNVDVYFSDAEDALMEMGLFFGPGHENSIEIDVNYSSKDHKIQELLNSHLLLLLKEGEYTFPYEREVISYHGTLDMVKKSGWIETYKSGGVKSKKDVSQQDLNWQHLQQIPNLCINLVNYINSHNTIILEKEGVTRRLSNYEQSENTDRFRLITVRDKVVEVGPPREDGLWTLDYRIAVEGHYRKEAGSSPDSEKTIWVRPYIKGPNSAPFKNSRYEVLAKKILEERELEAKFLMNRTNQSEPN